MLGTNDLLSKLELARSTIKDTLVIMANLDNCQSKILKAHALFTKGMREAVQEQARKRQIILSFHHRMGVYGQEELFRC